MGSFRRIVTSVGVLSGGVLGSGFNRVLGSVTVRQIRSLN